MLKNVDVAIIVPLEEEYVEFQRVFTNAKEVSATPFIEEITMDGLGLTMVSTIQDGMGKTYAEKAVGSILEKYSPKLIVCLGIAGGLSKDLKLGDVCYSSTIVDVYDNSKVSDGKDGFDLKFSPTFYHANSSMIGAIDLLRRRRSCKPKYEEWRARRMSAFEKDLGKINDIRSGGPNSMSGSIVCGAVSASETYNSKLKDIDRKISAIDTESGAIFERARRAGVPAISIRGISDLADSAKSELEDDTGGRVREYAASNAAEFLKFCLENSEDFVKEIRNAEVQGQLRLINGTVEPKSTLHSYLQDLRMGIQSKLSELSPEYKLLPKGYVLPLPRIRTTSHHLHGRATNGETPCEILEVLQEHRHVFISINQSYPEKSLSWVIADELARSELSTLQILPIVVSGDDVKPPNSNIEVAAQTPTIPELDSEDYEVVIVFDGVPLNSKSRMKFIQEQVAKHTEARFVFVDRTPSNIVFEHEFVSQTSCSLFDLCDVSFAQMSHFIQKNFDMNSNEANVIAHRLDSTFRKFQLPAHPSYFAGIPQNTLSALIQANQRAELMDLAVVGFLSFVVADDKGSVQLSRTTRERFLKSLAIDLNLEKRSMNNADLVEYTNKFAEEHDFEIDAYEFLKGFSDYNILNFIGGNVQFSLPFIEHYLLAKALSEDDDKALRYFEYTTSDFDFPTFDLYCEINPTRSLIDTRLAALELSLEELDRVLEVGDAPKICSSEVDALLGKFRPKADKLSKRVQKAIEDVRLGKDETHEKQRLIDAADRVNEEYGKQRNNIRETDQGDVELGVVGEVAWNWTACVTLLGSGSEHLDAQTKRKLIENLVWGADLLIEEFLSIPLSIDFEAMKAELTSSESLVDFSGDAPDGFDEEKVKKDIENAVDAVRFMSLSMPFQQIIGYLSEHARQPVLGKSLRKVSMDKGIQKFYHAIWMADVDVSSGRSKLSEEIRKMSNSNFLRVCMASHFLKRVYWAHASKSDRLAMLDIAETVLKNTDFAFERGEMERMIKKEAELQLKVEKVS
ncbi:5'-methylthioadenosine/S-adenosylhomocysteine nucleosidase family protein [Halocynthiibacter styelae]|uniref:Nucleoside phosphorylase domain-containing protein n=1 Tax=Halocynthiibacter styelae TaxID=2761955 RepID=A0A8J7LWD3_9RHOB|nr:hypothetical protein [Paenihalocynthiibacter styelae]MBI1494212.1 hypothetical protein [Paenihalocynthiibacter styelae]